jgi:hypothetical protein
MPFKAILKEVEQLHRVCARLEGVAEEHPLVSEAVRAIAESVRNTAVLLAILVAARNRKTI